MKPIHRSLVAELGAGDPPSNHHHEPQIGVEANADSVGNHELFVAQHDQHPKHTHTHTHTLAS